MPPLTLMIKPASSLCNMRCTYCFYHDVTEHREVASYGIMQEDTLEALVRRAFIFADEQVSFAFQGGEPTVAGKDFFRKLLALEAKYNTRRIRVYNSIQTNGYALDQEWAQLFADAHFLVGVSLDGTKAIHDACRVDAAGQPTFDRILHNIHLLEQAHVEYNVLCVVNQIIAKQPEAVIKSLQKHRYLQFIPCLDGLDGKKTEWSLDPVTYGEFLIKTFDLYEKAYYSGHPFSIRNFDNWISMLLGYPPENCAMSGRCGNYFLIESDGSAYPCDFYVLDEWKLGNVKDASFARLDKSPLAKSFREASLTLPDECPACPYLALCRGGCKRDREPIIDGRPSSNRLCAGHKLFFSARLERMMQLAKAVRKNQK